MFIDPKTSTIKELKSELPPNNFWFDFPEN
jgi:hypothetical protein